MARSAESVLGDDFLRSPAKNITVNRIDFSRSTLPEYAGRYAVILDNVLSKSECDALLAAAEATTLNGWERAMINIGGGRQILIADVRNCGRIIVDSREIVAKLWQRIAHVPDVQEIIRLEGMPIITGRVPQTRGEVWRFTRPNERMRFLKYVGGEYFRPHCDGTYETPDGRERSYVTLHLYLNGEGLPESTTDGSTNPEELSTTVQSALVGGVTSFHPPYEEEPGERDVLVMPKVGRILLFQHRSLQHSGSEVEQGVKYTMRTDLMYTLEDGDSVG